jgi:hypothetical protein
MDGSVGKQNVARAEAALVVGALLLGTGCTPASKIGQVEEALARQSMGVIALPDGEIEIHGPIRIPDGAVNLELRGGANTQIVAAPDFQGPAMIVIGKAQNVTISDVGLDGRRSALIRPLAKAPPENAFRVYYPLNGILADETRGLRIERADLRNIVNFPILVSRSSLIRISDVRVRNSGSVDANGRNNFSGGIVIEEGSFDFEVTKSQFSDIAGNGLWTHSLQSSPRLHDGLFSENRFTRVGRDAIQVGHASNVRVEGNQGSEIGFPVAFVDVEGGGTPVGIDTAGEVSQSHYARNRFDDVNGKCIDLDGFHHGTVEGNICVNHQPASYYPNGHFGIVMNNTHPDAHSDSIEIRGNLIDGANYGGLFVMGSNHRITGNRFVNLNLAACEEGKQGCSYLATEPQMLMSGIYVGRGIARPEPMKNLVIQGNTISGHRMAQRCIQFGPGVDRATTTMDANSCRDTVAAEPVQ